MGCCVLAVMIVGQVLEAWRRLKVFLGFKADLDGGGDPDGLASTLGERLRSLLRRPAVRMAIVLLLFSEMAAAGTWLYVEHKAHALDALSALERVFGDPQDLLSLCKSKASGSTREMAAAP